MPGVSAFLSVLGLKESVGWAGGLLEPAAALLFDGAAKPVLQDLRTSIQAYCGRIPPNHDLENTLRLTALVSSLVVVQTWRQDAEAEVVIQRSAPPPPPFLPAAVAWLRGQLLTGPTARLTTNPVLIAELETALDRTLVARDPSALRDGLRQAEAEMWGELTAGVAPAALPEDLRALFHGQTEGRPGWAVILQAFLREALKSNPRAQVTFVSTRLAALRDAMPQLAIKLDAVAVLVGEVRADVQGVAAGVETLGRDMQEVLAYVRAQGRIASAAAQGIPEPAVRAIVERLGGQGIARDDLLPWLDNWIAAAARELGRHTNQGEAYEAAWREAERRFRAGRLTEASAAFMEELDREERREAERQEERTRHRVVMLEGAIRFDALALDPAAIVPKLRMIATTERIESGDALGAWLFARAHAEQVHGRDRGDNAALLIAIAAYRAALEEYTSDRVPLDWAMTQNNLAGVLMQLAERNGRRGWLEEAVARAGGAMEVFREANDAYWLPIAERQLAAVRAALAAMPPS